MQKKKLKYIRPVNDIHLDFDVNANSFPWKPIMLPQDKETALVISGDLWHARKFLTFAMKSWMAEVAAEFHSIVFVLGNHDYWNGTLNLEPDRVKELIKEQGLTNVHLLECDTVVIDGVKFVGGTFWTNFNKQDHLTKMSAPGYMKPDYKYIRFCSHYVGAGGQTEVNYRKVIPDDFLHVHLNTSKYIFKNAVKDYPEQKLVVVTHMAPCEQSIDKQFVHERVGNGYYFSEYGNKIADTEIDLWFHGHTHNAVDYMINNTRVINNPRGYRGHDFETGFIPEFLIEV